MEICLKENLKMGHGKVKMKDGNSFEGEFKDNKINII